MSTAPTRAPASAPEPTIWPHMATFEMAVELARSAQRYRALAKAERNGTGLHPVSASQCELSARNAEAKVRTLADGALYEVKHYGTWADELSRRAAFAKATEP